MNTQVTTPIAEEVLVKIDKILARNVIRHYSEGIALPLKRSEWIRHAITRQIIDDERIEAAKTITLNPVTDGVEKPNRSKKKQSK